MKNCNTGRKGGRPNCPILNSVPKKAEDILYKVCDFAIKSFKFNKFKMFQLEAFIALVSSRDGLSTRPIDRGKGSDA